MASRLNDKHWLGLARATVVVVICHHKPEVTKPKYA